MDILINILVVLFCLLLGYIFGAIPTAVWVGKVFFHQDPRELGSKNAGGTNAGRLWGKKVGFCIILFDMFKTIAPVWICWALLTYLPIYHDHGLIAKVGEMNELGLSTYTTYYPVQFPAYWLAALGCMIGHCWPVFAGFKGGKGVSCFMGTVCGTTWMLGIVPGILYFVLLKWKKYVSLASIVESIFLSLVAWIWFILCATKVIPSDLRSLPGYGPNLTFGLVYALTITVMSALLIVRHHSNIARLREGNERKIKWMK